jgi:CRP-like cAMP-binding protein
MAKQLMPRAELESRDSDIRLTDEQFLKLSLFTQLKRKPTLDKYPGALVLRHFKKGEVICRQGEAGWTAFYILTSADALAVREGQLQAVTREPERKALEYEVAVLRQRVERLKTAPADDDLRTAAMVHLAVSRSKGARGAKPSLAKLLNRKGPALSGPVKNREEKTIYIPTDGPVTLSYESLRAPMQEGELFGEMSCLYRTPRSATVVARRDCYMIELLRNILDMIQKDPVYKQKSDEVYKKRALDLQLRKLSIFSDLTDAEFAEIRDNVELVSYEPGDLICDENDRSDSLFIVRSGLVKVIKNVSALLDLDDVPDWGALGAALREGAAGAASSAKTPLAEARGKVWQLLPERVRTILSGAADPAKLGAADRAEVIYALNDVLKQPQLIDAREFKAVRETSPFREQSEELLAARQELLKKKKDWSDPEARRCHRMLLEAVLPLRPLTRNTGPETILTYCSRGDYFGEIGLMLNQPRSATCIAYGHPNDYGQVELVRLPGRTFWKLMKTSAPLRDKVKQEIARRRKNTMTRLLTPVWDDSNQVQVSGRFEELGLIQGQQLMLIDLDRCTRCDECVKACVHTHDDGRSRLFLDGPRFGKYLVPTTCRSCLDPVCMIGCPVASIHRGDNREIIIEDWCIGCGLCAENCPYGSIQMHDLGLIPNNARGWRFLPAARVAGERWRRSGFHDAGWLVGNAPFYLDRELGDQLAGSPATGRGAEDRALNFRYAFHLGKETARGDTEFKLEVVSLAPEVKVWLNDQEVTAEGPPKRGRREYTLPQKLVVDGAPTDKVVRPRAEANVLAVRVVPPPAGLKRDEVLLQARLDEVRRPQLPGEVDEKVAEEITEKLVTERAVVCDLCSSSFGQVPACVNACPHDAAMRVNARFEFPRN